MHADTLDNSSPWSRGALAHDDQVTPSSTGRSTDATKVTFPLQLVILIVGGAISLTVALTGAFWVATSQIRSDMRDMATQQRDELRVRDVERKLADERYESMRKAIEAITGAQRLEEIRNQEMRVTVATLGVKK